MIDYENALSSQYVISKRWTGFGDCLISLIVAWWYAKRTGRTLVVDWRHSLYANDPNQNAINLFFDVPCQIDGVNILCPDHWAHLQFPSPFYPNEWNTSNLNRKTAELSVQDRQALTTLLDRGEDQPASTMVLHSCMSDATPPEHLCRLFLSQLRIKPNIQKAINAFRHEYFEGRKVLGIHIRHGNGGDIMGHAPYWADETLAINRCCRAIQTAAAEIGSPRVIFLSTDSQLIEKEVQARIPNIITRAKKFGAAGSGELHLNKFGYQHGLDSIIEMFLLSYSDILIPYPEGSFFSFYARLFCKKCYYVPASN